MKKLIKMDYFEYEHLKKHNPEKISKEYIKEYIDLIDILIEPSSTYGKSMHENPNSDTMGWMAIPGGIPPGLINGIAINTNNKNFTNNLEKIGKMFPNAVIFDQKNQVLRKSEKELQNQKRK